MLPAGTVDFSDFLAMMTVKMSEKDSKEEILKAFRLFDDDETGKISFKNLKRVAKELGENLTDEELQASAFFITYCSCLLLTFFFLRMRLRPIVGQPGNSSIISRVKLRQTTVQLDKRTGFNDVGHQLAFFIIICTF